jgi:hypothetical protein
MVEQGEAYLAQDGSSTPDGEKGVENRVENIQTSRKEQV